MLQPLISTLVKSSMIFDVGLRQAARGVRLLDLLELRARLVVAGTLVLCEVGRVEGEAEVARLVGVGDDEDLKRRDAARVDRLDDFRQRALVGEELRPREMLLEEHVRRRVEGVVLDVAHQEDVVLARGRGRGHQGRRLHRARGSRIWSGLGSGRRLRLGVARSHAETAAFPAARCSRLTAAARPRPGLAGRTPETAATLAPSGCAVSTPACSGSMPARGYGCALDSADRSTGPRCPDRVIDITRSANHGAGRATRS